MLLFKLNMLAITLLEGEIGFDLRSMWNQSGVVAKSVIIVLAIMSAWSIGVMIDRILAYSAARKQSREFAPLVAGCLKEGKIDEAISWYGQALGREPGSARIHCNLASAVAEKDLDEEALTRYEVALRLDPRYAEAHNGILSTTRGASAFR